MRRIVTNITLPLLESSIALAKKYRFRPKNLTALAGFCADYISNTRGGSIEISITTLTRNPIYRALLDTYLQDEVDESLPLRLKQCQIASANLRHDNKRLTSYIATLEAKQHGLVVEANTAIGNQIDHEKSSLIKTIDLLLYYFSDHVEIDEKKRELICPYLKSSERIIVSSTWAKSYITLKLGQGIDS